MPVLCHARKYLVIAIPPALRFIAIGCSAAAVHFAVVYALVETHWLPPLWANVIGWLVAFGVSFSGHLLWTFAHHAARWHQALPRFFAISAVGFAVNEATYYLALRYLPWRYDILLAIVLVLVAVGTYVVSKLWAFQRR